MTIHHITDNLANALNKHLVSRRVVMERENMFCKSYRKIRYELYEIQEGLPILVLERTSDYINFSDQVESAKADDKFEAEFVVEIMKLYAKQLLDIDK